MLAQIAWRNIWRNKIRSWVVIGSILIGIWSILFLLGFSYSMVSGYIDSAIKNQSSHLQAHNPIFLEDLDAEYRISKADEKLELINGLQEVESATIRTVVNGMVRSARGARGVQITGVIPNQEKQVTAIHEALVEGVYFSADRRNELIISQGLAEKLKVKLRKKVVLQFQDMDKEIVAGSFRIVGIFKTGNKLFDESIVFVNRNDVNRLLGDPEACHQMAVFLKDSKYLDSAQVKMTSLLPELLVENYRELAPDVELYESQIDISARIFTTIFMLALIFGIINTMLMAVLERNKELGMLMAIGMGKIRVFFMIVLETVLLGLIALPIGLGLAYLTIQYFGHTGIDLSAFSGALESFGISTIIYPELTPKYYQELTIAVFITALLGSLYPAWKAIKLKPIEAMHKI